jgi:hypothetical protein
MTDAGGRRQARGARRIDQQRAIVDGDIAPFDRRQRTAVEHCERGIDIRIAPDLRHALKQRLRDREDIAELARKDDAIGLGNIDAMRQRLADELGVDQRHHAADLADAEPGREIVGTRRHDQAHRLTVFDSSRQRPAGITIDALGKRAVTQCLRIRDQRRPVRLARRPILHHVSEQPRGSASMCEVSSIAFSQVLAAEGFRGGLSVGRSIRPVVMASL